MKIQHGTILSKNTLIKHSFAVSPRLAVALLIAFNDQRSTIKTDEIRIKLTNATLIAMLLTAGNKSAGICTPDNQGPQRPLLNVVFLCPSKTQAALCRLFSVMVGCIGQPLKRLAGSLAGSANLIQSATPRFAPKGGGLFFYQGVTA